MRKRRRLCWFSSSEEQLKVIREAKRTSRRATARRFGVDPKRVRDWMANEDKLLQVPRNKRRLGRCGRRPLNDEIGELLYQWIVERRSARHRVTRRMVMAEARRLHSTRPDGNSEFMASSGWLRRFMKRKISMRRRTTIAQRIPSELSGRVSGFITRIRHLRVAHAYSARCIAAMDETGVCLDMPGRTTLDEQGARTVAKDYGARKRQIYCSFRCKS